MEVIARSESWTIAGGFRIAREQRSHAAVVVVELKGPGATGVAECAPYARYGETTDSVLSDIAAATGHLAGLVVDDAASFLAARDVVQRLLPAGSARNAVDCAFWDLQARTTGEPAWKIAGLTVPPERIATMRTVGIGTPSAMANAALKLRDANMIKVKVDATEPVQMVAAVHGAAPEAKLVVDPNESWSAEQLRTWSSALVPLGVVLLEQPVASGADVALKRSDSPIPLCADESFVDHTSFRRLPAAYQAVNIKLDKTGGLTEALACAKTAHAQQLEIMVGCIVGTSLAMAPAMLLAPNAVYADLDGPFLLAKDRPAANNDEPNSALRRAPDLWGG